MKESKDFFLYFWFQEPIDISRYYTQMIQLIDIRNNKSYIIKCLYDEITSNLNYKSFVETYHNLDYYLFNVNARLEADKLFETHNYDPLSDIAINLENMIQKFAQPMFIDLMKYYNNESIVYQTFYDSIMMDKKDFDYMVENIHKSELQHYSNSTSYLL